jgi:acetyl esterase
MMTKPDYQKLIDAEIWAFIAETNRFYPEETVTFSVEKQRQVYDRMCEAFRAPRPLGIVCHDETLGGVPIRRYVPKDPRGTLVYFHGGGFVVGGLHSHDDVCAEIADHCDLRIIAVDYRLAPENPHPAAYEDALNVTRHLIAGGDPVILAGDSAGGCLAASVAHALRGEAIKGMVLIYPGLSGDPDSPGMLQHSDAPMLTRADVLGYAKLRAGGVPPVGDPSFTPLAATDFKGLPDCFIHSAECDPLVSDGPIYATRLKEAGGRATCFIDQGLVHGWLRARHRSARAQVAFARILASIKSLAEL